MAAAHGECPDQWGALNNLKSELKIKGTVIGLTLSGRPGQASHSASHTRVNALVASASRDPVSTARAVITGSRVSRLMPLARDDRKELALSRNAESLLSSPLSFAGTT